MICLCFFLASVHRIPYLEVHNFFSFEMKSSLIHLQISYRFVKFWNEFSFHLWFLGWSLILHYFYVTNIVYTWFCRSQYLVKILNCIWYGRPYILSFHTQYLEGFYCFSLLSCHVILLVSPWTCNWESVISISHVFEIMIINPHIYSSPPRIVWLCLLNKPLEKTDLCILS